MLPHLCNIRAHFASPRAHVGRALGEDRQLLWLNAVHGKTATLVGHVVKNSEAGRVRHVYIANHGD